MYVGNSSYVYDGNSTVLSADYVDSITSMWDQYLSIYSASSDKYCASLLCPGDQCSGTYCYDNVYVIGATLDVLASSHYGFDGLNTKVYSDLELSNDEICDYRFLSWSLAAAVGTNVYRCKYAGGRGNRCDSNYLASHKWEISISSYDNDPIGLHLNNYNVRYSIPKATGKFFSSMKKDVINYIAAAAFDTNVIGYKDGSAFLKGVCSIDPAYRKNKVFEKLRAYGQKGNGYFSDGYDILPFNYMMDDFRVVAYSSSTSIHSGFVSSIFSSVGNALSVWVGYSMFLYDISPGLAATIGSDANGVVMRCKRSDDSSDGSDDSSDDTRKDSDDSSRSVDRKDSDDSSRSVDSSDNGNDNSMDSDDDSSLGGGDDDRVAIKPCAGSGLYITSKSSGSRGDSGRRRDSSGRRRNSSDSSTDRRGRRRDSSGRRRDSSDSSTDRRGSRGERDDSSVGEDREVGLGVFRDRFLPYPSTNFTCSNGTLVDMNGITPVDVNGTMIVDISDIGLPDCLVKNIVGRVNNSTFLVYNQTTNTCWYVGDINSDGVVDSTDIFCDKVPSSCVAKSRGCSRYLPNSFGRLACRIGFTGAEFINTTSAPSILENVTTDVVGDGGSSLLFGNVGFGQYVKGGNYGSDIARRSAGGVYITSGSSRLDGIVVPILVSSLLKVV